MSKHTNRLPEPGRGFFLTDGGMETTLIFLDGIELPHFAAFVLIDSDSGIAAMRDYYTRHLPIALEKGVSFILESPTWRAGPEWGAKLGYDQERLSRANRACIDLMARLRADYETAATRIAISGCIGPRGDGYDAAHKMTGDEAEAYHAWQVGVLKDSGADFVTAMTMTHIGEGLGIARAAKSAGIPSVISFTVETDGRLPSGESLAEAITTVDSETESAPLYYMINCAHPTHFDAVLATSADWLKRIGGIRANASRCSHEELDNATQLDSGNPSELGQQYRAICARLPNLCVLGGCCGTDDRHIREICAACC